MTQERTLVILAQILAVLILLNIFSSYNEGYDPRLENHKRNQDDVSDIEGSEDIIYLDMVKQFIEIKPYKYEHITREHISDLQTKAERENIEEVPWKEKLRQRINKEKPYFYKILKNEIPENVETDLYLPDSVLSYIDIAISVYDPNHLNIIIRDPDNIRWELPHEEPYPYVKEPNSMMMKESNFDFVYGENPLRLKVMRKGSREVIFELIDPFIYTDRFIEFNFRLPSNQFYGFGERLYHFSFKPGTFSEFILDRVGDIELGSPGYNGQGHHPMYLIKEKSNKWHINYIRNINGQEFTLDKNNQIQYRMIGGVIDLNFFLGDTPEEAVERYHRYIGGWTLPPFWAMGKHQSKWEGYQNNSAIREMIFQYTNHKIPLDVAWSDIEYQKEFNINFSIDEDRYPLEELREIFKKFKKKWVPVIDTFVPKERVGPAWKYPGVENLLLKAANGTNYVGYLFRDNHVIDFWNPETPKFWNAMLDQLREKLYFEGIWIDANENTFTEDKFGSTSGKYSNLKYWPGSYSWYDIKMPKPDAYYFGGVEEIDARDTHCMLQSKYSFDYLKKTNPFPFVLTRANMPGIGKFAFHFYPDYRSNWGTLRISIPSTFNYNIFGIPFSGGDLCGMGGIEKTSDLMCARWYQLGIFYPFVRNHHIWQPPGVDNHQEPYRYDGIYYEAIYRAMKLRYAMLKYYYTLFFVKPGKELKFGMVFKPVGFVFHDDKTLPEYDNLYHETEFMIGDGILVAPMTLKPSEEKFTEEERIIYFPEAKWFDLRTYSEVFPVNNKLTANTTLPEVAPFYLRGGYIFYLQNVDKVLSTADLDSKFDIIVGFSDEKDGKRIAEGEIMDIDDFEEKPVWENCVDHDCIMDLKFEFEAASNQLTFSARRRERVETSNGLYINKLVIMGIGNEAIERVKQVEVLNIKDLKLETNIDLIKKHINITFAEPLKFEDGAVFQFKLT